MEIIFVVSAINGGGAERVLVTLANRFASQGDSVTILMTAGTESAYSLAPEVQALSIGQPSHGNPLVQAKRLFRMRKYFKEQSGSYIVSFSTTINLYTILASLGLKNRVVVSERNDPNRCGYKWLRNFIYGFGKGFVFQTEDAANCFPERIRKKGTVIPNPIRTNLPEIYCGVREKKIAAAGRLEPQKNQSLLLDAFAGFHKKYPDYELHIFGRGKLENELREQAKRLLLEDKVIFEGFRSDILEMIRTYGMYVLCSDYEGISNSLMEAMALGLPCISTDCPIGGSRLCIQDGENGLLVPTGDVDTLRRAMERLAEETETAKQLGQRAALVRETFAEDKIADIWHRFIEGR